MQYIGCSMYQSEVLARNCNCSQTLTTSCGVAAAIRPVYQPLAELSPRGDHVRLHPSRKGRKLAKEAVGTSLRRHL